MNTSRRHFLVAAAFCLLLSALLLGVLVTRAQDVTLADACDLAGATSVTVIDYRLDHFNGWTAQPTSDLDLIAQIGAWSGVGTWTADATYGHFDEPTDLEWGWEIDAVLASGDTRYVFVYLSPSDPSTVWIYGFIDLSTGYDANGEHFGAHHLCASFAMPAVNVPDLWW